MINEVNMCLVAWLKSQTEKSALVQQLNCFHTQGSGIARRIREEWPIVYDVDVQNSKFGDKTKLGTFTWAEVIPNKFAFGLYSQFNFGGKSRCTSYDALADGLITLNQHLQDNEIFTLGLPKRIGSALGGGSWPIVEAIITDVFQHSPIDVYICDYQP